MPLLTATYDADHKRIVMHFMADGRADYATLGDVTEAEIEAAFLAEGGPLPGWSCELS